jgi:hypothetical protein
MPQFLREPAAHVRGNVRILKEQGALKELPAVQAGSQNEMAVQQSAGPPEKREQIFSHERRRMMQL